MQITKPDYYKEFSCIAGDCPDTCCAGWQIMIDEKSLRKYSRIKGDFRPRLHNGIDWKNSTFRQYHRRCEFLNENNLCDIYSEAGKDMLCHTCRTYPRHIEEFEGLREISLSLSCPEAARILLSQKHNIRFLTAEKEMPEETYEEFDYLLFTALMDTRDSLLEIVQNRRIPISLRLCKLLACAHDFQLCYDKNELYKWECLRNRHLSSGFGENFLSRVQKWKNHGDNCHTLITRMWKTILPEMEVLSPGWHEFLGERLLYLYTGGELMYRQRLLSFYSGNPDWEIQMEQLLVYWIFTYFCGAVYDGEIFAKVKMAVISTLFIRDLAAGRFTENQGHLSFTELVTTCYRFSRELEHSDPNLNKMEELLSCHEQFSLADLLKICEAP